MTDALRLLIEWRDAREEIFKADLPTPAQFSRLASAELDLMAFARALPKESTP